MPSPRRRSRRRSTIGYSTESGQVRPHETDDEAPVDGRHPRCRGSATSISRASASSATRHGVPHPASDRRDRPRSHARGARATRHRASTRAHRGEPAALRQPRKVVRARGTRAPKLARERRPPSAPTGQSSAEAGRRAVVIGDEVAGTHSASRRRSPRPSRRDPELPRVSRARASDRAHRVARP
jgi:hypothetical protein